MNVIIAGTRYFNDYELLKEKVDLILDAYDAKNPIICSGGACGADGLGERYANEHGLAISRFNAQWDKYGKKAGPIRNGMMADIADLAICFWDGNSRGTHDMINQMRERGKPVRIIIYN